MRAIKMGNIPTCQWETSPAQFPAGCGIFPTMKTDDDSKAGAQTPLAEAIRREMTARGFNQKSLAEAAGLNVTAVRDILIGKSRSPRGDTISKIAAALDIPAGVLLGDEAPTPSHDVDLDRIQSLPGSATMARDLPVIGTAAGGDNGDFELNGQTVDYVRRPPALAGLANAFAIYLVGHSMEPRYDNGGLLLVHPGRPVSPGCDVLVELHGEHGGVGHCMVKTLVRKAGGKYILKQYNPPRDDIEVPIDQVRHIYRVLRPEELLGV